MDYLSPDEIRGIVGKFVRGLIQLPIPRGAILAELLHHMVLGAISCSKTAAPGEELTRERVIEQVNRLWDEIEPFVNSQYEKYKEETMS